MLLDSTPSQNKLVWVPLSFQLAMTTRQMDRQKDSGEQTRDFQQLP